MLRKKDDMKQWQKELIPSEKPVLWKPKEKPVEKKEEGPSPSEVRPIKEEKPKKASAPAKKTSAPKKSSTKKTEIEKMDVAE